MLWLDIKMWPHCCFDNRVAGEIKICEHLFLTNGIEKRNKGVTEIKAKIDLVLN